MLQFQVVSYVLYGDKLRNNRHHKNFLLGAEINVKLVQDLYPGWFIRNAEYRGKQFLKLYWRLLLCTLIIYVYNHWKMRQKERCGLERCGCEKDAAMERCDPESCGQQKDAANRKMRPHEPRINVRFHSWIAEALSCNSGVPGSISTLSKSNRY